MMPTRKQIIMQVLPVTKNYLIWQLKTLRCCRKTKRYTQIYRKWLFGGFNRNRETVTEGYMVLLSVRLKGIRLIPK